MPKYPHRYKTIECPECGNEESESDCLDSYRYGSGSHKGEREYWYRAKYHCVECGNEWTDEDCSI